MVCSECIDENDTPNEAGDACVPCNVDDCDTCNVEDECAVCTDPADKPNSAGECIECPAEFCTRCE